MYWKIVLLCNPKHISIETIFLKISTRGFYAYLNRQKEKSLWASRFSVKCNHTFGNYTGDATYLKHFFKSSSESYSYWEYNFLTLKELWLYEGVLFNKPSSIYDFVESLKNPLSLLQTSTDLHQFEKYISEFEKYLIQLDIEYKKKPKSIEKETQQLIVKSLLQKIS